jgi:Glyoxalase/Bleomycin resistance protein/Dioxygenase superfamily
LAAELSNPVWAIRVRQAMNAECKNQTQLKSIAPQFAVPDVIAAAEHYRDILGFRILGYFGQPPVFSIVARDNVEIQLGKSDSTAGPAHNSVQREGGLDAYVWVTDVDSLYTELKARGANIFEPPQVRVYHCYEMVVEDRFGFRLAFAMDHHNPA